MKTVYLATLVGAMAMITPSLAAAHTNSVGFRVSPSAATTCVGGGSGPCFDVEIFYGTWHSGVVPAEGDLALWLQNNPGETQVVGQSAAGGSQIAFSTSHSLVATIPNSSFAATYNYSVVPSADYSNLASVFSIGADYFFHTASGLGSVPDVFTGGVYSHQSAVAVGLGPGSYRIDYDAATSGGLSANWSPTSSISTAIFTLTAGGGVVVPAAPPSVALSTTATGYSGPFSVTVTFSEPVSGLTLSDFVVGNGSVSNLTPVSSGVYQVLVTPSVTSGPVTVDLPADMVTDVDTNGNIASNQLVLNAAPPPTTPFTPAVKDQLRQLIVGEATKGLRSQMAANQRFSRGARDRFLAGSRCRQLEKERINHAGSGSRFIPECDDGLVSRNNIPFDIAGNLVATSKGIDLSGTFFGQTGNFEGSRRRLVYGEFDLTGYDTGSVVGTLSGRVAWEQTTSESTMLGYFVGGEVTRSQITSTFSGTRDTLGLSLGAYYVENIGENLVGDTFVALGIGMNNLDVGNGTVDVTSNYLTASIQAGAAISGSIEYEKFTLSPEIAVTYGLTRIGDVGVSGTTVTVSGTDTIAAGTVAVGVLNITPRLEIPLEISGETYDEKQLTISPTVLCQIVKSASATTSCGAGLELQLVAKSYDRSKRVGGRLAYQSVGGSGQGNISLFYERSF